MFFYREVPARSYGIEVPLLLSVIFVKHIVVPFMGRQQEALEIAQAFNLQSDQDMFRSGLFSFRSQYSGFSYSR